FLGLGLLGFRDLAVESVDMVIAPFVRGIVIDAARPKAPPIAGRALSVSPGGHVHRPAPTAMRPLRQKSSRIRGCNAFETSQLIRCRRRSHLWAGEAAAGFGGATFRISGTRRLATRKASMIARNASAKASIEASR